MERATPIREENSEKRDREATDRLFTLLLEHHDYSVPKPSITKTQAIKIIEAEANTEKVDVCVLPIDKPKLTINAIQRVVCRQYGISHADMLSPRRDKKICDPRMIAVYLSRELTTHGYPTIGKYFHRDHTSIIHAVRKIDGMIKEGHPISSHVANLRGMLTA